MNVFEIDELVVENAMDTLPGAVMPERVVQEVLKAGFLAIQNDLTLLDDLFYKLPQAALDSIKEYYGSHQVTVRQNFPRDDLTWPIVAVVSGGDNEDVQSDYLGGFEGADFELSMTGRSQVLGHALRSDLQVICMSGKDANAALWLYYLAKAILMIAALTLESQGLQNVTFTGRDIQLRDDLTPEMTYARVLGVSCVNYFAVRVTERVASAVDVAIFTQEPFSGTKTQMNVEDP
jgi:hypothetical protein